MWFYWYRVSYRNDFGSFVDEGLVSAESYREAVHLISVYYGEDNILELKIKFTENEELFIINSKDLEDSEMKLMVENIAEEIERVIKERERKEV